MKNFFKKAFRDMKESIKEQFEVDKIRFEAARAESKATFEEAKAAGDPENHKNMMRKERGSEGRGK